MLGQRQDQAQSSTIDEPSMSDRKKPILEVQGIRKVYKKNNVVVSDVSLKVYPGEIIGLLGPNGAGKTTCFHMICGLRRATAGKIFLDGQEISKYPMFQRCQMGLEYLPQERSTFDDLTVEENLLAVMEFLGMRKKESQELCTQLLERFELIKHRKDKVGSGGAAGGLSGGERRRLEFARALIRQPKVLMLDEPFAACDPPTINTIQKEIRKMSAEGLSIIINDHSIANTLRVINRAYVIQKGGWILCDGTAMDVISNPYAIATYFDHEAKDNAESIGIAQGYTAEEAKNIVKAAYEEMEELDRAGRLYKASREEIQAYNERKRGAFAARPPRSQNEEPTTRPAAPTTRPEHIARPTSSATAQTSSDDRSIKRPRLSLNNRGAAEPTPSPRDQGPEANRYLNKLTGVLKRRKR
ncbi:MAG: LPS export ABC transporter ATP-binding protein [Thermoguttaceae bacterium]